MPSTLKGKRDRAILSTLLYHGLRREELTKLKVKDYCQTRRGVAHLRVQGKGGKMRFVPTHPGTLTLIEEYLEAAGHGQDTDAPLFRPVKNNVHGHTHDRTHAGLCLLRGGAEVFKEAQYHRGEHGAARDAGHGRDQCAG